MFDLIFNLKLPILGSIMEVDFVVNFMYHVMDYYTKSILGIQTAIICQQYFLDTISSLEV